MDQKSIHWLQRVQKTLKEEAAWRASDSEVIDDTLAEQDDAEDEDNAPEGINDKIDTFLGDIVEALVEEYDIDEEEAFNFALDVAEAAADEGMLPYLPDEDATNGELVDWYGKANTAGFAAMVLQAAADSAE